MNHRKLITLAIVALAANLPVMAARADSGIYVGGGAGKTNSAAPEAISTAPVYGLGIWFTLFGVGVRAEYEKINMKELDNAHMLSASAFYQF